MKLGYVPGGFSHSTGAASFVRSDYLAEAIADSTARRARDHL
jgi:hypothetical protein